MLTANQQPKKKATQSTSLIRMKLIGRKVRVTKETINQPRVRNPIANAEKTIKPKPTANKAVGMSPLRGDVKM